MNQWESAFKKWLANHNLLYGPLNAVTYGTAITAFEAGYKQAIEDNTMDVKHPPVDYPKVIFKRHCFGESPISADSIVEESLNSSRDISEDIMNKIGKRIQQDLKRGPN